jgi:hypothetical protein
MRGREGRKLPTLTFCNPRILIAIPMTMTPPTEVNSRIMTGVKKL